MARTLRGNKQIVCLLGMTGVGKSKFANILAGKDAFIVGEGVMSCTVDTTAKEVTWFDGDGMVTLVDVPGIELNPFCSNLHI